MQRYLLRFEYLGLKYNGSQKQIHGNTIQDKLEEALCTLINQKKLSTIFSGRTDTGVSAKEQTAHFDCEAIICDTNKFLYSLNAILPNDIVVYEIKKVSNSFHAQMSAKYRHYRYVVRNSLVPSVFDQNVFHTRMNLNPEKMNTALKFLEGEHDFSAFKSSSDNPAKICKIYYAGVKKEDAYINIDIIGNRFLYNMVRTIVGTLFEIEKTNAEPLTVKKILESKNRSLAGPTISPCGLTLIKVGYDDYREYTKKS